MTEQEYVIFKIMKFWNFIARFAKIEPRIELYKRLKERSSK